MKFTACCKASRDVGGFQQQNGFAVQCQIGGTDQAVVPCAYDDRIVMIHMFFCCSCFKAGTTISIREVLRAFRSILWKPLIVASIHRYNHATPAFTLLNDLMCDGDISQREYMR